MVVTGDKDALQLITDKTKVKLVTTAMGSSMSRDMTPESFFAEYGFEPIHMIDLKALMGDNSDHLIGVPGVCEKTAKDLIGKYRSIEAIYEKLPEIDAKPGVIKKLTEENIPYGKHCATRLEPNDYDKYDYFICMEERNISNTLRIFGTDPDNKIFKLLSKDIADPWYTGNFNDTIQYH